LGANIVIDIANTIQHERSNDFVQFKAKPASRGSLGIDSDLKNNIEVMRKTPDLLDPRDSGLLDEKQSALNIRLKTSSDRNSTKVLVK